MTLHTTSGIPYVEDTDDVRDYPTAMEELATVLEDRVGAGAWVTALPASPADGEEVVLVDSLSAPSYVWRMKWLAAAAKWLFVGGLPAAAAGNPNAVINTKTQVGSTGFYYDAATMSFTVPRAGTYRIQGYITAGSNGGTSPQWAAAQGFAGSSLLGTNPAPNTNNTNAIQPNVSAAWLGTTGSIAASTVIGIACGAGLPGTWKMYDSAVFVTPFAIV